MNVIAEKEQNYKGDSVLNKKNPTNYAYMNPADMEDLNDEELLECRLAIRGRAKALMRLSEKGQYYE